MLLSLSFSFCIFCRFCLHGVDVILNFCSGNRASAVFVGVYEPVKRKLLSALPDQLTWLAHMVKFLHMILTSEHVRYFKSGGLFVNWFRNGCLCDLLLQQTAGICGATTSSLIRVPTEVHYLVYCTCHLENMERFPLDSKCLSAI